MRRERWTAAHEAALGRAHEALLAPLAAHEAALRRAHEALLAPLAAPARAPANMARLCVVPSPLTPARVLEVVARESGLPVRALASKQRSRTAATARHAAMWLLRTRTSLSYPEIASAFGKCHHTTALSAVRKVEQLRLASPDFAAFLARCESALGAFSRLRIQLEET